MKRTIKSLMLTLAITFGGPTFNSLPTPPHTGIQGQSFVYISYGWTELEPGVWVGPGDVQLPVASTFTILSAHNGREVAQVTTDADGRYSVALPPGDYVVVSEPINLLRIGNCPATLSPMKVSV